MCAINRMDKIRNEYNWGIMKISSGRYRSWGVIDKCRIAMLLGEKKLYELEEY